MHKVLVISILLFAAGLLFLNLGNQYLWQDEGETALLAKNVLQYGYPRAFDGKNLITPSIRTSYGENYGWRYHPWGQFYLTALSFKLFGITTFGARALFALIGLINLLLLYLLTRVLTKNKVIALYALLLTATSVPYILMMRQCRYYAPAVFLILFIIYFYKKFLARPSGGTIALISFGLICLGHTVHGMFVPLFAAIGTHYLIFHRNKKTFYKLAIGGFVALIFVIPWFLYSNSGTHIAHISLSRIWKNLEFQIRMINKYIFPVVFFAGVYVFRLFWRKNWKISLTAEEKETVKTVSFVIFFSMFFFCFAQERNFRYLIYFIPLLAIFQGMILFRAGRFNRFFVLIFLSVSILTNVLNLGQPSCFLPKFIYQISHDYDGPVEGIVRFLKKNANAGDVVKISYGDLAVIFYTGLEVDNSRVFDDAHMPKWIVFRRWWDGKEFIDSEYFRKVKKTYTQYTLDYPDIPWENRPGDMGYHRFSTDKQAPGVIVFEKK